MEKYKLNCGCGGSENMSNFIISVDSSCDYRKSELDEKNIKCISFNYSCEQTIYTDKMEEKEYLNFYNKMKEGKIFKTSQINPESYYNYFKELLSYNLPIIHISLGSGVSNTINSAFLAINQLKEDFDNVDIRLIDTKLASMGSVLIMDKLLEFDKKGLNVNEAMNQIEDFVFSLNAYYTTNTLTYFARGGRLSKVEAFIGNAIKINPIMDCDPNGKLRVIEKVRGSRKAFDRLIEKIKNSVINPENQIVYICHADNEESAKTLGERLIKEVGFKEFKIYLMGPIIGAHAGPGVVACFFFGEKRT